MTVISDLPESWPNAIVDIPPLELSAGYWAVVGLIPYEGHVVLAVSRTPPFLKGTHS